MTSSNGALPVIQYWHSADVPAEIEEISASFGAHNPDRPHLMFDEASARLFIREHFTPREEAAFAACAVPSMQGDYFSYCVALTLGGVYSDVGFRCTGSVLPLLDTAKRTTLFKLDSGIVIHGFFVTREPGDPLLRLALDIATLNIERRISQRVNVVTGPYLFNGLLQAFEAGSLDQPEELPDDPDILPLVESFQHGIGHVSRVQGAFDGVGIAPIETVKCITRPDRPLAYKRSDLDWVNWCRRGDTIFR